MKKIKITPLQCITLAVIVLTIISAFAYRTSYFVFFLGQTRDAVTEKVQNNEEIRIEVENNEKITIKEIAIPIVVENESYEGDGRLTVEILDRKRRSIISEYLSEAEIKAKNEIRAETDNVTEISGDFTIYLYAENFDKENLPALYLSNEHDITDKSILSGTIYQNNKIIGNQPCVVLGTTLRDNLYFPAMVILTIVILIANGCVALIQKWKSKNECMSERKTRVGVLLLMGGYLLYELWSKNAGELCSWIGPWYVLDYGVGMGSRLFIGSIMKVFFYDSYLDKSVAYYFVMAILSLLVILIAYMFAQCFSRAEKEYRRALLFLFLCYIASPGSVGYLWNKSNLGRLELYLFLLALVAVVVNLGIKNIWIRYMLIGAISVCMFAIHQGNLFTYFPVIYMLCIYNVFGKEGFAWREFFGSLFVAVTSGATFVYFHFFSYIKFESLDEMARYVGNRTNLNNNVSGLQMEYFSGLYGMFDNCFLYENYRICGILQLFVLWPLIGLGFIIGYKALKRVYGNKTKVLNSPYIYLLIFNLIYIPVFMFECDWARWFAAIITTKTIEIFYLYYVRDEGVVSAIAFLNHFLKNKEIGMMLVIMYLATMEKFGSAQFLDCVERLRHCLFPLVV